MNATTPTTDHKPVTAWLSAEDEKFLKACAAQEDRSVSAVVRRLIREARDRGNK